MTAKLKRTDRQALSARYADLRRRTKSPARGAAWALSLLASASGPPRHGSKAQCSAYPAAFASGNMDLRPVSRCVRRCPPWQGQVQLRAVWPDLGELQQLTPYAPAAPSTGYVSVHNGRADDAKALAAWLQQARDELHAHPARHAIEAVSLPWPGEACQGSAISHNFMSRWQDRGLDIHGPNPPLAHNLQRLADRTLWPARAPALEQVSHVARSRRTLQCRNCSVQRRSSSIEFSAGMPGSVILFRGGPTRATFIGTRRSSRRSSTAPRKSVMSNRSGDMFWARLQIKPSQKAIFVATAHLTSAKHSDESETGVSPRVRQLKRIADELTRLVREGEPAFFMGDMNDAFAPPADPHAGGICQLLRRPGDAEPAHLQVLSDGERATGGADGHQASDLIVANSHARAIAASVPQCYAADLAPSDHWPVQAIYQLA